MWNNRDVVDGDGGITYMTVLGTNLLAPVLGVRMHKI